MRLDCNDNWVAYGVPHKLNTTGWKNSLFYKVKGKWNHVVQEKKYSSGPFHYSQVYSFVLFSWNPLLFSFWNACADFCLVFIMFPICFVCVFTLWFVCMCCLWQVWLNRQEAHSHTWQASFYGGVCSSHLPLWQPWPKGKRFLNNTNKLDFVFLVQKTERPHISALWVPMCQWRSHTFGEWLHSIPVCY